EAIRIRGKERVVPHGTRVAPPFGNFRESRPKIVRPAGVDDQQLHSESARGTLCYLQFARDIGRIAEKRKGGSVRQKLVKKLQPFCRQFVGKDREPRDITAWPRKIWNDS